MHCFWLCWQFITYLLLSFFFYLIYLNDVCSSEPNHAAGHVALHFPNSGGPALKSGPGNRRSLLRFSWFLCRSMQMPGQYHTFGTFRFLSHSSISLFTIHSATRHYTVWDELQLPETSLNKQKINKLPILYVENRMVEWLINNKLGMIRQKTVMANVRCCTGGCTGALIITTINLQRDSRSPGQNLNPGTPH